jgi:hypothetical protein
MAAQPGQLIINGVNIPQAAPLVPAIYAWAGTKAANILEAYTVGGGFEVWAQIEIAVAVRRWCQFAGIPANLQREAPIFAANNQLAVDFAVNYAAFPHIVELKVEGSNPNADNATIFAKGLDADITKLIEKKVKPEWNDHPGLAVGISCTDQAAQATEKIFQNQGDRPLRINIANTPLALWVYARRVKA